MRTVFCRALWGMSEGRTLAEKFQLVAEAGYDGVEASIGDLDPAEVTDLCDRHGLAFIAQIFPLSADDFRSQLQQALAFRPLRIVSQTGRDKWSFDEGSAFWREALAIEADLGHTVAHETHRFRIFYSPWQTRPYLEAFPQLRIAMDLSHWCNVCETMLEDAEEEVSLAIDRAIHMHARVGHREGPQVSDPRTPENEQYLLRHAEWWDALRARHGAEGAEVMTVTPEFGPPAYLQTLPFTNQPVTSLWDVNLWMRNWLCNRWGI